MDLTLLTLLTFPLWEAKNASDRGNVNNVNNVKSTSGFSQESQIWINIINIINISPARSIFFGNMDLTLLTLLTFPLWEAKNASGRGNVNNVNNVKSTSGFSQESQIWINIINIINISPARSIFLRGELTLLTFLAFWLKCRVANARKPNKNRVFEHVLCEKDANTGGSAVFGLKEPKKRPNFGATKNVPKKGLFLGRIRGGERFGSKKGRWIRTHIYVYQKNPHAHKNKIRTSTPPFPKKTRPPPLKGGIIWAWGFSCRKNAKMPGAHKIIKLAQPFPVPELRVEILWTSRFFWIYADGTAIGPYFAVPKRFSGPFVAMTCRQLAWPKPFFTLVFCVSHSWFWKGGKDPHPQDFSLTKKTARFTKGHFRPY